MADRKGNRQKVSVWTDSTVFLYHVFTNKCLCKITKAMSRKHEDVWLKTETTKCYIGRICICLWQISSSAIFVTIWLSCIHVHTLSFRHFSSAVSGSIKSFSRKKKPLVSRVHSPAIGHNSPAKKCLIGSRATTWHCQIQNGGNTSIVCLFQWKEG